MVIFAELTAVMYAASEQSSSISLVRDQSQHTGRQGCRYGYIHDPIIEHERATPVGVIRCIPKFQSAFVVLSFQNCSF